MTWQIGNRARGHMPDLDEYLAMRLLTCGGEPPYALLELANGEEVPARELHRPVVRALTEMAIMVAALDNDGHSLRKELARGHTGQNVYHVLMGHQGTSLAEAVTAASRLRDRILTRFLRVREQVLAAGASAALRTYLDGLCHGIRGNIDWGLRVPRYLSLGTTPDALPDALATAVTDRPTDTDPAPPPHAPSIAWWWDDALT